MRAALQNRIIKSVRSLFNYNKIKSGQFFRTSETMGNVCAAPRLDDSFESVTSRSIVSHLHNKRKTLPQIGKIKLLSYNIFVRPPMINNNGDDYKNERLEEFLKRSYNYDIICLQEMFGSYSDRKSTLLDRAQRLGFVYSASSPRPSTLSNHFIDGGLLILSRYPINASDFREYPAGIGSDYFVQKGALYAKIKIGESNLHLFTTHAQATYDGTPKYFLKRVEQFTTFKKFVNECLSNNDYTENDLVLLTGDFNVNGREAARFKKGESELAPAFKALKGLSKFNAFSEYEALMTCLSNNGQEQIEDVLYKKFGEHPVTFGDSYVGENNQIKPRETVLTHKECFCTNESLDYIFRYTPSALGNKAKTNIKPKAKQSLVVKEETADVEMFLIAGHDFDQLSDHYGVKVTLEYVPNKDEDKEDRETASASPQFYESPSRLAQLE